MINSFKYLNYTELINQFFSTSVQLELSLQTFIGFLVSGVFTPLTPTAGLPFRALLLEQNKVSTFYWKYTQME